MQQVGPFSLNEIVVQDALTALEELPDESIDIVIADPPYNLSKGGRWQWDASVKLPGFGGAWTKHMEDWDSLPLVDYLNFTIAWLTQVKRVVRPTGSIWLHGSYHNIGIMNFALQLLEIEIINEVVWYKRNSFPNLSGRRLTASHETILWAHTGNGKRSYTFNYEAAKQYSDRSDLLKNPGKQMRTVWDIPNNKARSEIEHGKHPAQKPIRLLRRMLTLSARSEDIVLAPFAGVGSECVAAAVEGLSFIGFDTSEEYVDIARARLAALDPISRGLFAEVSG